MNSVRRMLAALLLLATLTPLLGTLSACAPRRTSRPEDGGQMEAAVFERLYRKVPQEQKDRLLQFRATHPYQQITVGGNTWRYIACGHGEQTLVLLPGASRQAEATFVLITLLEDDYRIIVPSYPPVRTMKELADGIAGILEAEGVTKASVWGTSFGGMLAHWFVHRYPQKVDKLILANSGIPMLGKPILAFLRLARYMPTVADMTLFRQALSGAETANDSEREFWRARLEESFALRYTREDAVACIENSIDFIEHSAASAAPWPGQVLFLESDRDQSFKPAERQALRDLYPQAQVYVFRNAPHEPWRTHRAEYISVLKGFLGSAL